MQTTLHKDCPPAIEMINTEITALVSKTQTLRNVVKLAFLQEVFQEEKSLLLF